MGDRPRTRNEELAYEIWVLLLAPEREEPVLLLPLPLIEIIAHFIAIEPRERHRIEDMHYRRMDRAERRIARWERVQDEVEMYFSDEFGIEPYRQALNPNSRDRLMVDAPRPAPYDPNNDTVIADSDFDMDSEDTEDSTPSSPTYSYSDSD